MITLRKLVFGCWFDHGDVIRERDTEDRLVLICERCGSVHRPDLSKDLHRGTAHTQAEILGQPITRVKRHADRTKVRAGHFR